MKKQKKCHREVRQLFSMTQASHLETELQQLECHFTWALKKEDIDISDLLNRLEENIELNLGGKAGVAQAYNCSAYVRYLLGSPTEALSNVQKSVELTREYRQKDCDKWLIVTYGNLAWLHYHMKSYPESESYLEKLREIAEKFPTESACAFHHEVLGEKAWALFKFSRKYYERAKECFRKALELEPDEGEWNTGYAILLYRTEAKLSCSTNSAAIKQLRRAIDTNPDDDMLKTLLGLRLAAYKKYSEAESLVEAAFENSPGHPHVIRYVGKFYRNQGSVDRAIALFKRALERVVNPSFIHHQLALCYKKKKDILHQTKSHSRKYTEIQRLRKQCIYHLEMATTIKPTFVFAMSQLALQYGENRDFSRAEELFQTTFQTTEEKQYGSQLVHFHYAQFQQYSVRCEPEAMKHYMECLKMDPNTTEGKRSAGSLRKIATKRLSLNPKDGEALRILEFLHEEHQATECDEKNQKYEDNEEDLSNLFDLNLSLQ